MTIKFALSATGVALTAAIAGMVVALSGVGVYSLVRPSSAPQAEAAKPQTVVLPSTTQPVASSEAQSAVPIAIVPPEPVEPHGSREMVLKVLKDPDSAQFRDTFYGPLLKGERAWCGEVNAKNSFGGYPGFTRFVSLPTYAFVDNNQTLMATVAWPIVCEGKIKTPTTAEIGKKVYQEVCAACHAAGVAGAPKFGDKAAWAPRLNEGMDVIHSFALKGKGVMPPKGGYGGPDADVIAASDFMVGALK